MSEFYIGYLLKAPDGIRRRNRMVVVALLCVAAACAFLFAESQRTFSASAFEFGSPKAFEGVVEEFPYPTLIVRRPGAASPDLSFSRYLLVATGKHSARSEVAGLNGQGVQFSGQLIYRENLTMIEIVPGSLAKSSGTEAYEKTLVSLGQFDLSGEIVDTKCYFGVMNPGQGKVHRDCAVRCISGGIPSALVTRDLDGTQSLLLLTNLKGEALAAPEFMDRVGQPVRIHGDVFKSGETHYLQTQRSWISALP